MTIANMMVSITNLKGQLHNTLSGAFVALTEAVFNSESPRQSAQHQDTSAASREGNTGGVVRIDDLTEVPLELFKGLLKAAEEAQDRGQHYLHSPSGRNPCLRLRSDTVAVAPICEGSCGSDARTPREKRAALVDELDPDLDMLVDLRGLGFNTSDTSYESALSNQDDVEALETLLNRQVHNEFTSSVAYVAMASYFDRKDVALPGFKAWASTRSREDRAQKLIEFLPSNSGVRVSSMKMPKDVPGPCTQSWNSALDAMESALRMEVKVHIAFLRLHAVAEKVHMVRLCEILESEYFSKQVQLINQMATIVRQLIRAGPGFGEREVDRQMVQQG